MASHLTVVEAAGLEVLNPDQETGSAIINAYREARDCAAMTIRKVVVCGLLMSEQKSRLKHGQFGPWLEKHCPEIPWRTAQQWMAVSESVMGLLQFDTEDDIPLHRILSLPSSELPDDHQDLQAQFFDLVDGKSQKQLLFEFKSTEERKYHPPKSDLAQRKTQKAHDTAEGVARQLINLMGWVQTSGVLARVSNATRQEIEDARIELGHYLRDIKKPNKS